MLITHASPRWAAAKRRRVITTGTSGGGEAGQPALIPEGAEWWYSSTAISDTTINAWNADAVAGTYVNSQTPVNIAADGMPRNLSLKNLSTKVRVGKTGTYRGVIRACRRDDTAPAADPTGGPNDVADAGGLDPAHAWVRMLNSGGGFQTIPYGQLFEIGFRIMMPDSADGDIEVWSESSSTIVAELETTSNRTCGSVCLKINQYAAAQQFLCQSCLQTVTGEVLERTYKGGSLVASGYRNSIGGPAPSVEDGDGFSYAPNTWYRIKIRGVIDYAGSSGTYRGWLEWYIDDMETPVAWVENLRAGKKNDAFAGTTVSFGQYGGYHVPSGKRANVYFDDVYLLRGATGYPARA